MTLGKLKVDASNEKDLDKRIDIYGQMIAFFPIYGEAYYDRATAYFEKRLLDRAIEDYSKAIELDIEYTVAYCNRGYMYWIKGCLCEFMSTDIDKAMVNYRKAITDFDTAIKLNPKYADAYYYRCDARKILIDKISDPEEKKTYEDLADKDRKKYNELHKAQ